MKSIELKQWLRDNSSGVYRPALEAADMIEHIERENAYMKAELERIKETWLSPEQAKFLAILKSD